MWVSLLSYHVQLEVLLPLCSMCVQAYTLAANRSCVSKAQLTLTLTLRKCRTENNGVVPVTSAECTMSLEKIAEIARNNAVDRTCKFSCFEITNLQSCWAEKCHRYQLLEIAEVLITVYLNHPE